MCQATYGRVSFVFGMECPRGVQFVNTLVGARNPGDSCVLESKFAIRMRLEQPPIVVLARSGVVENSEKGVFSKGFVDVLVDMGGYFLLHGFGQLLENLVVLFRGHIDKPLKDVLDNSVHGMHLFQPILQRYYLALKKL